MPSQLTYFQSIINQSVYPLNRYFQLFSRYVCMSFCVVISARKIMNNDNEPPSLMQFWSHADDKLVINKSWPKNDAKKTLMACTGNVVDTHPRL